MKKEMAVLRLRPLLILVTVVCCLFAQRVVHEEVDHPDNVRAAVRAIERSRFSSSVPPLFGEDPMGSRHYGPAEPDQAVEEPVEEVEEYSELLKVDWTLYGSRKADYSLDRDGTKLQRMQRFQNVLCLVTDEEEQCCLEGQKAGEKAHLTSNLYLTCNSTASEVEDRNDLCLNRFKLCCQNTALELFYEAHLRKTHRNRKTKKRAQSSAGN